MTINQYYHDELKYLRELGKEFSEQNPGLSKFLASPGEDPDVERLFEGVAFLTGRIRQKLDDDLPELTHSLINLIWPNYLRPVPAMSILEFDITDQGITSVQKIPKHSEVQSIEVEKTHCKFRTCYDVDVYPLQLAEACVNNYSDGATLNLVFEFEEGINTEQFSLDYIRLFIFCEQNRITVQSLYLWLFNYLDSIELSLFIREKSKPQKYTLPRATIKPVGYKEEDALLPDNDSTFSGYRLLQEFFQFPEKFQFFDITEISELVATPQVERFEVSFKFNRQFENQLRVSKDDFKLFCTPVVNLFESSAEPLRISPQCQDYIVKPQHKTPKHVEIFSIQEVSGKVKGQQHPQVYPPFESFEFEKDKGINSQYAFYKMTQKPSILDEGLDTYLSFITSFERNIELRSEVISVSLLCTNRQLPRKLRVGDICLDTGISPISARFKNITTVRPALSPPLQHGLHWRLIANLALNYHTLDSVEALKTLVRHYDFDAFTDRVAGRTNQGIVEGIEDIRIESIDRIVKGMPVRGLKTTIELRESKFGSKGGSGEASMYAFASVLNQYFKQYSQVNSLHTLEVIGIESQEHYYWEEKHWNR